MILPRIKICSQIADAPCIHIYIYLYKIAINNRNVTYSIFLLQLFDKLKANRPEFLTKVQPVKGDITMEGLGLSDEDETRLAEEVQIVFHAAATINFQVTVTLFLHYRMLR